MEYCRWRNTQKREIARERRITWDSVLCWKQAWWGEGQGSMREVVWEKQRKCGPSLQEPGVILWGSGRWEIKQSSFQPWAILSHDLPGNLMEGMLIHSRDVAGKPCPLAKEPLQLADASSRDYCDTKAWPMASRGTVSPPSTSSLSQNRHVIYLIHLSMCSRTAKPLQVMPMGADKARKEPQCLYTPKWFSITSADTWSKNLTHNMCEYMYIYHNIPMFTEATCI